MKPKCPRSIPIYGPWRENSDPKFIRCDSKRVVIEGRYFRKSDSRWIDRFACLECRRSFSRATLNPCFGQKKRRVNTPLKKLLCAHVTHTRAAKILRINRKTVARKRKFLATVATQEQRKFLVRYQKGPLTFIQFDDLETIEQTKCKPLSVALAVEPSTRKILSLHVSQMPARGPLAAIARVKYPARPDQRRMGWNRMMEDLKPLVHSNNLRFLSDENPHYPRIVRRHFPHALHDQLKGQRGCIGGQGELKKVGFDPLFSLNHTCAMLRANVSRLIRRTWATTKKKEALEEHLAIYVNYHNRVLTPGTAA